MADEEDLKLLRSGEIDLSRCDFRNADLSGLDLRGRDFSYSLFEKANAAGANFSGSLFTSASMSFLHAPGADFSNAVMPSGHCGFANFAGANFFAVIAEEWHLANNNFRDCNLKSANFSRSTILQDNNFEAAVVDQLTSFDGVTTMRPVARDPIFTNYEYRKGVLFRIGPTSSDADTDEVNRSHVSEIGQAVPASNRVVTVDHNSRDYIEIVERLDELTAAVRTSNSLEASPDEREQRIAELNAGRQLIKAKRVDPSLVRSVLVPALRWIGEKAADHAVGLMVTSLFVLLASVFGINLQ